MLPRSGAALAVLAQTASLALAQGSMPPQVQATPLDFEERCADPGVVLCDPLDLGAVRGSGITRQTKNVTLPDALGGKYFDWRWCHRVDGVKPLTPVLDETIRASGSGSVRFAVPGNSGAGAAGYCQINFTPDNSVQFGEGETFFVQYRVRLSCEMLYIDCDPKSAAYKKERRQFQVTQGQRAFKLSIVNAGDHAQLEYPVSACTRQQLVLLVQSDGAVSGFHSCGWYDGHSRYLGLNRRSGRGLHDRQPVRARATGGCFNLDPASGTELASAWRGCVLWEADRWITVTQQVTIGRWADKVTQTDPSSNVRVWIAEAGQPHRVVIDFDRNLRRPERPFMKYGKVWLVPHFTNKDPREDHPTGYIWFDELIVSRTPIAPAR
jgi:hypothetical protein